MVRSGRYAELADIRQTNYLARRTRCSSSEHFLIAAAEEATSATVIHVTIGR